MKAVKLLNIACMIVFVSNVQLLLLSIIKIYMPKLYLEVNAPNIY